MTQEEVVRGLRVLLENATETCGLVGGEDRLTLPCVAGGARPVRGARPPYAVVSCPGLSDLLRAAVAALEAPVVDVPPYVAPPAGAAPSRARFKNLEID